MTGQAMKKTLKSYGLWLTESVYSASVYSIIAYSALLALLAVVAVAVGLGAVEVPEFHPK